MHGAKKRKIYRQMVEALKSVDHGNKASDALSTWKAFKENHENTN